MIPELLVPAGDMDSAKAAINGGADAVYLGGKNFSARSFAANFADDEIETLIDYAALRGVKIYIAVNTLYNNEEMPKVFEFVSDVYKKGAAAFILQDMGLARLLKNNLPEIELHASTQMTVHSVGGAKFMKAAGFSRVILSRELSLAEVSQISAEADIETEVFAHGALCVSYSGQCLLSSMVGGRSGNRGKCAQPCRLSYDLLENGKTIKSGHLLSPKDMMTLEILEDIIKTGVTALKIEGRMKSPEYVHVVTKAYREQLDTMKPRIDKSTINDVLQIFNRGGSFSTGYYNTYAGAEMMSTETPKSTGVFCGTVVKRVGDKCTIRFAEKMIPGDGIEIWTSGTHVGTGISRAIDKNDLATVTIDGNIEIGNDVYKSYDKRLIDETKKAKSMDTRKSAVIGEVEAKIGKPVKLTLQKPIAGGVVFTTVSGENAVEKALKAPMSKDEIINQLSKTGNAPFSIKYEKAEIDEDIFISKAVLNEVRREAVDALEKAILNSVKRPNVKSVTIPQKPSNATKTQKLTVQIKDIGNLAMVLQHNVARVYLEFSEKNINGLHDMNLPEVRPEIFLALPSISRNENEQAIKSQLDALESANFDGYLVATYGQLCILQEFGTRKKIWLDHNIHIFNNWARRGFEKIKGATLSQELTASQLKHMDGRGSEIIIHGRQVLMATHNCPIGLYAAEKNGKHCNKRFSDDEYALLDRKNIQFPIVTDCDNCVAYVLNSKTLDTAAKFREIKNTGIEYLRLVFFDKSGENLGNIITTYEKLLSGTDSTPQVNTDYTYGHFFRGVD